MLQYATPLTYTAPSQRQERERERETSSVQISKCNFTCHYQLYLDLNAFVTFCIQRAGGGERQLVNRNRVFVCVCVFVSFFSCVCTCVFAWRLNPAHRKTLLLCGFFLCLISLTGELTSSRRTVPLLKSPLNGHRFFLLLSSMTHVKCSMQPDQTSPTWLLDCKQTRSPLLFL